MNRRELLAATGVGSAALLAGCTGRWNGDGDGGGETPQGQWELRATVGNEDDVPREWRVECRSADGGSVAAAYSTLPPGEATEIGLLGQLRDEEQEVYVESENGAIGKQWRPTQCRHLAVDVTISDGEPTVEEECVAED